MRNLARTFTFVAAAVAVTVFGGRRIGRRRGRGCPARGGGRGAATPSVSQALLAEGLDANATDGGGRGGRHDGAPLGGPE